MNNNLPGQQHRQDNADVCWTPPEDLRAVSLKYVADLLDTTRSSARRWLKEAGIRPHLPWTGHQGRDPIPVGRGGSLAQVPTIR